MSSDKINDLASGGMDDMRKRLIKAYERGRKDGMAEMRDNILRAASAPDVAKEDFSKHTDNIDEVTSSTRKRAPRGLVPELIKSVLTKHPGLNLQELEERILAASNNKIATRSIYGELQRRIGKLYYRDGVKWFLVGQVAEKKTAGPTTNEKPAASHSNQGDANGTAIV